MSIKQKLLNTITIHPKLVTFGVGIALTMAVGTAIGMLDHGHIALLAVNFNKGNAVSCC